jgi:hypothetical protein
LNTGTNPFKVCIWFMGCCSKPSIIYQIDLCGSGFYEKLTYHREVGRTTVL